MSNLKLLSKILRLKDMKITDFWFKNRDKELLLAVKPYKNGYRCPECGRRGRIVRHSTAFRRWEDLTLMGMKVLLWYAPKEIHCPTHGRVQEEIPWAPAYSHITNRLEWRICALCQIMTQKAAAEVLKMAPSTVSDLLHRIIHRVRNGHKIRGVKDFRAVFIFHDKATLDKFITSGWQFGGHADAAAVADDKGVGAVGGEAVIDNISIYQLTKTGLALQATVKGTKCWIDRALN